MEEVNTNNGNDKLHRNGGQGDITVTETTGAEREEDVIGTRRKSDIEHEGKSNATKTHGNRAYKESASIRNLIRAIK